MTLKQLIDKYERKTAIYEENVRACAKACDADEEDYWKSKRVEVREIVDDLKAMEAQ
jgi:hypothetical protein